MAWGRKKDSDTGNRTPSCRVRGGNVSRYTISDLDDSVFKIRHIRGDWMGTSMRKGCV